jgi:signal peptidase I
MKKWILIFAFLISVFSTSLLANTLQDAQIIAAKHSGQVFQVSGESMMKFFRPGSLIVTIPADFNEVKAGQVIVYKNSSGKLVVHRAVRKVGEEWVVRGSENGFDDLSRVNRGNLEGVVYVIFNCWGNKKEKTPAKEVFALEIAE